MKANTQYRLVHTFQFTVKDQLYCCMVRHIGCHSISCPAYWLKFDHILIRFIKGCTFLIEIMKMFQCQKHMYLCSSQVNFFSHRNNTWLINVRSCKEIVIFYKEPIVYGYQVYGMPTIKNPCSFSTKTGGRDGGVNY